MGCEFGGKPEDYCGTCGAGSDGVSGLLAGGVAGCVGVVLRCTFGMFSVTDGALSLGHKRRPSAMKAAAKIAKVAKLDMHWFPRRSARRVRVRS